MVGSTFILLNKNGRRTLLNTAQITSVTDLDIMLGPAARRIYWEFPPEQEMAYIVRIEQPDGHRDYMFTDPGERDELLNQLIAAMSPGVTINSAPGLPHTWPELARMVPRYTLQGKEYATEAEYKVALDNLLEQMAEENAEWARRSAEAEAASSKPPRKPYTRKPRE